jgi:hypothetical protein
MDLDGHLLNQVAAFRYIQDTLYYPADVYQLAPAGGRCVGGYSYGDAPVVLRA